MVGGTEPLQTCYKREELRCHVHSKYFQSGSLYPYERPIMDCGLCHVGSSRSGDITLLSSTCHLL